MDTNGKAESRQVVGELVDARGRRVGGVDGTSVRNTKSVITNKITESDGTQKVVGRGEHGRTISEVILNNAPAVSGNQAIQMIAEVLRVSEGADFRKDFEMEATPNRLWLKAQTESENQKPVAEKRFEEQFPGVMTVISVFVIVTMMLGIMVGIVGICRFFAWLF